MLDKSDLIEKKEKELKEYREWLKDANYHKEHDNGWGSAYYLEDEIYLLKNNIPYKPYTMDNQMVIDDKVYCPPSGKWRNLGKNKWYKSKSIKDFCERFVKGIQEY